MGWDEGFDGTTTTKYTTGSALSGHSRGRHHYFRGFTSGALTIAGAIPCQKDLTLLRGKHPLQGILEPDSTASNNTDRVGSQSRNRRSQITEGGKPPTGQVTQQASKQDHPAPSQARAGRRARRTRAASSQAGLDGLDGLVQPPLWLAGRPKRAGPASVHLFALRCTHT